MLTKKALTYFSKQNLFKISLGGFKIGSIKTNQLFKINSRMFAEKEKEQDQETHSDFKPKSKISITNENVMNMIDQWVKENDVLLFMKGVPQLPQCGYSNYVCQLLKFYNIKNFKSVNILEDNILRESVKKYSSWPTYPQLYVKGNLVGNYIL